MINQCTIIGRVGRDPQMRKTSSRIAVASFPVAVDTSKRGPAESKEPVWFDVSAWDKLAEIAIRQFKRGDLVYVVGQVSLHTYTAHGSSEKRTTLRLNASDARLLSSARLESAPESIELERAGEDTVA
jgi:single-strand DNA-binding protein